MAWLWLGQPRISLMACHTQLCQLWAEEREEADGRDMGRNFAEYNELLGKLNMQKVSRVEAEAKTQGISLLKIKF